MTDPFRLFQCKLCDKTFTKECNLKRHKTIHGLGERFICDTCGKVCLRKDSLSAHLVTHQNTKNYVCDKCKKTFTRKCGLRRHKACCHQNSDEREHFVCHKCGKVYSRKDILRTHLAAHNNEEENAKCGICYKKFTYGSSLLRHIQNEHKHNLNDEYFQCNDCHIKTKKKGNLKNHILRIHLTNERKQRDVVAARLKCLLCDTCFRSRNILLDHYVNDHHIEAEFKYHRFASVEEFEQWKSPHYVCITRWTAVDAYVQKFRCHRSGVYKDPYQNKPSERKRQLKSTGSKKLQGVCPAEMIVRKMKNDGSCLVKQMAVHVGHVIDDVEELQHLYLTHTQRQMIAKMLLDGVSKEVILQKLHQDYVSDEVNSRLSLLSYKDIGNIAKAFGVNDPFTTYNDPENSTSEFGINDPFAICNDPAYVDNFVLEHEDSIVFFKKQNEIDVVFNTLEEEDFLLIFQNEFQKESLLKYGGKVVAFDGTRGTSQRDFVLHTMLVADLCNEGIPTAFLMSNRSDQIITDIFVRCIKGRVGVVNTKAIMCDVNVTYLESWSRIMVVPEFFLFCTWHVRTTWEDKLKKLIAPTNKVKKTTEGTLPKTENRGQIIDMLKTKLYNLANDLDETSFLMKLTAFLSDEDPIVQQFLDYFQRNYAFNTQHWALCYRMTAGVNVNMRIESFHRVLKYKIAKGKKIQTLAFGLACINNYMKYFQRQREIRTIRPTVTKKQYISRHRHAEAEQYVSKHKEAIEYHLDQQLWRVPTFSTDSDEVVEVYTVQQNGIKECLMHPESCPLPCKLCSSCIHEYQCSCPDFANWNNMCEHIHIVSLCQKNEVDRQQVNTPAIRELQDTIEFPLVCDEAPAVYNRGSNTHESLEELHKSIEEKFREIAQYIKSNVTLENKDVWHEVDKQCISPIKPLLESIKRNSMLIKDKSLQTVEVYSFFQ